jgi:hypothetical protein
VELIHIEFKEYLTQALGANVFTDSQKDRFEYIHRNGTPMKNCVLWDVTPCGSCKIRRFGELSASFIRVTRIGEPGTLAVTNNRRTL